MRKYTKVILITLVSVSLISIVFPAIPPHSWYSKIILTHQNIISELNLNKKNCHYETPIMLIESRKAAFVCITDASYKVASEDQKAAINNMRNILEKNGWKFSESKSWKHWDIVYNKGLREIRIYPYDWGPGCTGVIEDGYYSCKLFVRVK